MMLIPLLLTLGCSKSAITGDAIIHPVVASQRVLNDNTKEPATKPEPLASGGTFSFPDNAGGKLLEKILTPEVPALLGAPPLHGPSERVLPSSLSHPEVPLVPLTNLPPRIPLPARADARPMPLPERVPLSLAAIFPEKPERIELPVGALTRLETPDVKQPASVPILARQTSDRASLEDPTQEFTLQSVINHQLPLRTNPAPFIKVNLPDPFENGSAAKMKIEVKEDPTTAPGTPPAPKP